jgi:hypothetical protein
VREWSGLVQQVQVPVTDTPLVKARFKTELRFKTEHSASAQQNCRSRRAVPSP